MRTYYIIENKKPNNIKEKIGLKIKYFLNILNKNNDENIVIPITYGSKFSKNKIKKIVNKVIKLMDTERDR